MESPFVRILATRFLAWTCCREAVPVDYTKSTHDVYQATLSHHVLRHSLRTGTEDEIQRFQRFHEVLRITSCKILKSPLQNDQELKAKMISIMGKLNGQIIYVSPLLDQAGAEAGSPNSSPSFLFTPIDVLKSAHYIARILSQQDHPPFTRELDLVHSLPQSATSVKNDFLPDPKEENDPSTAPLHRVINHAQTLITKSNNNDCIIAFSNTRLICFVPSETKVGDLVCQFIASNVIAIIRSNPPSPDPNKRMIVGRAINAVSSSHPQQSIFLPQTKADYSLFFDLRSLQLMTAASATPDSPNHGNKQAIPH